MILASSDIRLLTRLASATKQINQSHSFILSLLESLHNLQLQLTAACIAASKQPQSLASSTGPIVQSSLSYHNVTPSSGVLNDAPRLLVKSLLRKIESLVKDIRSDGGIGRLQKAVSSLYALRLESVSAASRELAARDHEFNNVDDSVTVPKRHACILDIAKWIDASCGMYEQEIGLLGFLVDEMEVTVTDTMLGNSEQIEGRMNGRISVDAALDRWRSLGMVDLVFEGYVMEVARCAVESVANK